MQSRNVFCKSTSKLQRLVSDSFQVNGSLEGNVINHGVKLTTSLMFRDWGECNPKVVHRVRFIPDRSV